MTQATYIIGPPGAGKSTLMAQMLEGWTIGPYTRWHREVFGHYLEHPEKGRGAYLGHLRPEYPGTDALSLSAAPRVLEWLEALPLLGLDQLFAEGTRLCHLGFLQALDSYTDLTVIYLNVDDGVAAQRRADRGGKLLSEHHCKVVTSKARNVAAACRDAGIRMVER